MSGEGVEAQFHRMRNEYYNSAGYWPNRCTLSLALARLAAKQHEQGRRYPGPPGMFQQWDASTEFVVDAKCPPDIMYLDFRSPTPAGDAT